MEGIIKIIIFKKEHDAPKDGQKTAKPKLEISKLSLEESDKNLTLDTNPPVQKLTKNKLLLETHKTLILRVKEILVLNLFHILFIHVITFKNNGVFFNLKKYLILTCNSFYFFEFLYHLVLIFPILRIF